MSIEDLKKNRTELLTTLNGTAVGGKTYEFYRMAIISRCTDDIEVAIKSLVSSMDENAKSSHELAKKVYWLNIVLVGATLIGTLIAVRNVIF